MKVQKRPAGVVLRLLGSTKLQTMVVLLLFTSFAIRNNPSRLLDTEDTADQNMLRLNSPTKPRPWTTIHLIGERHSGTKWMTQHLMDCFQSEEHRIRVVSALSRWKHWFRKLLCRESEIDAVWHAVQVTHEVAGIHCRGGWCLRQSKLDCGRAFSARESVDRGHASKCESKYQCIVWSSHGTDSSWCFMISLTRSHLASLQPYHSPNHFNMTWNDFVSTPWTMERFGRDRALFEANLSTSNPQEWTEPTCQYRFRPHQAIPCLENKTVKVPGYRPVFALYELHHDGSGRAYDTILQLRADKIRNFLQTASFRNVRGLYVVRYEDMVQNGTESLIRQLEKQLGVAAQCEPTEPQSISRRPLPRDFVDWMRQHVDWETERLIGYEPE